MSSMACQITSLTIVYSPVYSGTDKKKTSKLRVTGLCAVNSPVSGEFPAQMASNAENVSIWWRHHVWETKCCVESINITLVLLYCRLSIVISINHQPTLLPNTKRSCKRCMNLTLNVRGYPGLTRSISWLLMAWLLVSSEHQQPGNWLCKLDRSLSYMKKEFN